MPRRVPVSADGANRQLCYKARPLTPCAAPGSCEFGAGVVELVDTPDLGSGGASCGGSSPSARTTVRRRVKRERDINASY